MTENEIEQSARQIATAMVVEVGEAAWAAMIMESFPGPKFIAGRRVRL